MKLKIFGDTTPIDWTAMGIKMPFAPMHDLAQLYELTPQYEKNLGMLMTLQPQDIDRTFETRTITAQQGWDLAQRISYRAKNTIAALDQCTPNTICINLGGGYHHAGKYPDTGYAYSLINDIIWAVDYQLAQDKNIGVLDLDFHFGGGTFDYYRNHPQVYVVDQHNIKQGILHQHEIAENSIRITNTIEQTVVSSVYIRRKDKQIINIGTDIWKGDALFGKYTHRDAENVLEFWISAIMQGIEQGIPTAITMGGGYGPYGLKLYESLISWLCWL